MHDIRRAHEGLPTNSPLPADGAPLISVVVATYQAADVLPRCIESVAAQTYPHVELVVQDGASTDGTLDVLQAADQAVASWASAPDTGLYQAWNRALARTHGHWVCFLGADDYFCAPNVLARMIPHLQAARPAHRIVYGCVQRVLPDGTVVQVDGTPWEQVRRRFLEDTMLPHQGVFHHRSLFDVHGRFDERFRIMGDYEMLLRELKARDAYFADGVVVTAMPFGGLSSQTEHAVRRRRELRLAQQANDVEGVRWRWWLSYLRALVRHRVERALGPYAGAVLADAYRLLTGRPRLWTRLLDAEPVPPHEPA
jgi:glycosyltransferase involved in cell wall biosynthesis